ncbi:MAG: isochorismatase family protein [Pseudomonadota bacterium]
MSLPHGPLRGAHLIVVDMQRLFVDPGGPWHCPDADAIIPPIAALMAASEHTVFTRFITPTAPEDAVGAWQHYYHRWRDVLAPALPAGATDVVRALEAPEAQYVDKTTYGAFEAPAFEAAVPPHAPLVVCGVETDVCVLATVFSAVDRGHRVVVAADAVASSDRDGHDAALLIMARRFDPQIELAPTADILAAMAH